MKNYKKVLAAGMALSMGFTMGLPAQAAEGGDELE